MTGMLIAATLVLCAEPDPAAEQDPMGYQFYTVPSDDVNAEPQWFNWGTVDDYCVDVSEELAANNCFTGKALYPEGLSDEFSEVVCHESACHSL